MMATWNGVSLGPVEYACLWVEEGSAGDAAGQYVTVDPGGIWPRPRTRRRESLGPTGRVKSCCGDRDSDAFYNPLPNQMHVSDDQGGEACASPEAAEHDGG
jgi:hypothetical protein